MASARAGDDRDLAGGHAADPVPEHRARHAPPAPRGPVEAAHHLDRRPFVHLVVQRGHASGPGTVPAHATGEEHDAPQVGAEQLARRGREREPAPGQPQRARHPPPYGGWIANSSPGRIRVVGRSIGRPLRTNRLARSVRASFGYAAAISPASARAETPSDGTGQTSSLRPTAVLAVANSRTRTVVVTSAPTARAV
jgi:hypothetical protein